MKKILSFLFILSTSFCVFAQVENSSSKIPDDINIKTGTFSNGLKYYIKQNRFPSNKLELRLILKVGSIVEEENQQGLAHFMEHMCFNGTKNFEKNELISYLQSIGVEFGAHLNAVTFPDKTVFRITIPTDKKAEVEQGFQILEDWAFDVTLSDEEINKERGVVIEEYRTRLGAENRMRAQYLDKLLYNSRYTERLPIGKKEIIENFEPETLRQFYKDWYRPDLMAIIAVGDISADELEEKVKKHFDKPVNTQNAKERIYYSDESHENTLVAIVSDKEASKNTVSISYKNPEIQEEENTEQAQLNKLKEYLFSIMINNRFKEMENGYNPPFVSGQAINTNSWVKHKKVYSIEAEVLNHNYKQAIQSLITENERIKRHGFTPTEFKRAKEKLLLYFDNFKTNRGYQLSEYFVKLMEKNFFYGSAMPSTGWLNNFNRSELSKIQLEDVNNLTNKYLRKNNRVVIAKGRDKQITEKEIIDLISTIENDNSIEPYEDIITSKQLFSKTLSAGKIINEEKNKQLEITSITLNNGVKVHYKNKRSGHVYFNALSKGGSSFLNEEDYWATYYALQGMGESGIGGFSKNELNKLLMSNSAEVSASVFNYLEMMEGNSKPKDLETLFQLIYLTFTQVNKDEKAFNAYKLKSISSIENRLSDPEIYFKNEFNKFQYAKAKRSAFAFEPTKEDYENTNYDLAYEVYQKRFENAADFDFVFVGNIDEQKFLDLAKKYLGNLPTTKERESYVESKMNSLSGDFTKRIYKGTEDKAKIEMVYRGDYNYNNKEDFAFDALKEILQIKITEKLREEASDVYTPSVSNRFDGLYNSYSLKVHIDCAPENVDKLIALTKAEVQKIISNGPEKADLNKAKEAALLNRTDISYLSSFWLSNISNALYYGTDINEINTYEKNIKTLSIKDIQTIAQKFLDKGAVVGILLPESKQ
ncbi:MAG: M16 family metallopeptidase [Chitinophagales bacterium]